ncbi:MAG: fumarate reductase subunit D [Planctomycetaceae bacterium]|nr:fumarate reductase subunit D [Planctomycetaceae bacterium]
MARSKEPIWWSMFSAGGVIAAFLIPATLLITGFAPLAGYITAEQLHDLIDRSWLVKIYLFILIALPLFHWAHRFRFTVADLGLRGGAALQAILFYGAAIVGTICAAVILIRA